MCRFFPAVQRVAEGHVPVVDVLQPADRFADSLQTCRKLVKRMILQYWLALCRNELPGAPDS